MYLYTSTLKPEDAKRAQGAVDLAVECGVPRQYATQVMESGDIDMLNSFPGHIFLAASGIMSQYENQYATPDKRNLVSWTLLHKRSKR